MDTSTVYVSDLSLSILANSGFPLFILLLQLTIIAIIYIGLAPIICELYTLNIKLLTIIYGLCLYVLLNMDPTRCFNDVCIFFVLFFIG